jgi:histidinol-phosphate phosphatase family protein
MPPCVFLDRDGVINCKPRPGEYICRWEEFRFIPAIVDWIRLFNALELLVIVVTNQRGVARGLVEPEELARIHKNMIDQLGAAGAGIDDVFCCPHEEGVCDCRKPAPGLVLQAARKWDIDLARSIMIGDSARDQELAQRCGMQFIAVADGRVIDWPECRVVQT